MKDCPEKDAPEMFQVMLSSLKDPDKISDHSLAHVCQKVMKLKNQACHESKIVFYADRASETKAVPVAGKASFGAKARANELFFYKLTINFVLLVFPTKMS